ncbi:MAG: hypothetical protein IJL02_09695 [Methanobrevibacter sp.]|uniref:hypothetical protein n=1 Tax=Methanobrevibacter sp. TaxID=66852 RepID=UPI0025DEA056|nr:hypothetical protein [Methanobrevibacter sp.]MBQ6100113.1 hypothetical protein [Methanobrevibacter sp.]
MYVNMNDKNILEISRFVQDLKNILDYIGEKFHNIHFKKENSLDNLVSLYSENQEFLDKLGLINELMNNISNKLEGLDYFQDEFYFFLPICSMISYIINDIRKYILFSSFVRNLSLLFCDLITTKISQIKSSSLNEYEEDFNLFKRNFFNQKEFFYSNIYECSHQYDDLIVEVANILR